MNRAKMQALATFLNESPREIVEISENYGRYEYQDQEFLVLEDEEADDAVQDTIELLLGDELADKVKNMPALTQRMIASKGRAFYLAKDNEENLEGDFYIYRVN